MLLDPAGHPFCLFADEQRADDDPPARAVTG